MEYGYKEVEFWKYCEKCKHYEVEDVKDPCNDCLDEPVNLHSTKPVYFEEK
jgi:hypothetical protein|uniref:Urotensin II n=1 Tax=Siphoviridae sp. ctmYS12 TaxID=2825652 RepID=A0A8S5P833_9CAUD|nr:MAG TPA: Urotensin II [Siphoviridae sp. ctmYS12]